MEVLWLEPIGGVAAAAEVRESVNPVIFREGGLDGWGWDHFDERAEVWGIPSFTPPEGEPLTVPPDEPNVPSAEPDPTPATGTTI